MLTKKEIGVRLKKAREFRGLKTVDAARRAGLTVASISRYEGGIIQPGIGNAIRLAEAYQMSLDDIFVPINVTK